MLQTFAGTRLASYELPRVRSVTYAKKKLVDKIQTPDLEAVDQRPETETRCGFKNPRSSISWPAQYLVFLVYGH